MLNSDGVSASQMSLSWSRAGQHASVTVFHSASEIRARLPGVRPCVDYEDAPADEGDTHPVCGRDLLERAATRE